MTATMSKALLANPPPDSFDEIKPGSLIGLISESHLCIDCGFDTAPGCLGRVETELAFMDSSGESGGTVHITP
jgi:hypothetical protein